MDNFACLIAPQVDVLTWRQLIQSTQKSSDSCRKKTMLHSVGNNYFISFTESQSIRKKNIDPTFLLMDWLI